MEKPTNNIENGDHVNLEKLPKHVAIIMDGNGRWAKQRFLPRTLGHTAGVERVRDVVEECIELEIPYLTLYAFSKENWKRPKKEIDVLMKLLSKYLKKETQSLNKNGVKINIMGDIEELPENARIEVEKATKMTKDNEKLVLNLALNYGARQEITQAFKKIYSDLQNETLSIDDIDEDVVNNYLYTNGQPDPDLIIRTSGEQRISNFMLYQAAYSEFDFIEILWPDFDKTEFRKSIIKFQNRTRRYGGI